MSISPPQPTPEGECIHDGNPQWNPSTMIRTIVKDEKWVICMNCRKGWNKADYLIDKETIFNE